METAETDSAALDPATVMLRPAGRDDLVALSRLYVAMAEAHGHAMERAAAEAKLARMLTSPAQRAVLFEAEGKPVGYILWADLGDHVFIRNFALAAEHKGPRARPRALGAGAGRAPAGQAGAPRGVWRGPAGLLVRHGLSRLVDRHEKRRGLRSARC